jgi:hypothetical protein
MARTLRSSVDTDSLLASAARGEFDEVHARLLYQLGPEAVTLAFLAMARRIAELQKRGVEPSSPSTPSGMVPVYSKPTTGKRRKRPGARKGHPGARRSQPTKIDQQVEHRQESCPDCGGQLQHSRRSRKRIIEDIPEDFQPVVTEHTIHRSYCPQCTEGDQGGSLKDVEPIVPDALPNATWGHHITALTSWLHYGLGVTLSQVVDILGFHLQTRLTSGGLLDAWRRVADILKDWYEQIAEQARHSAVLHADETGWRVNGQTCWLWCFANHQVCYYMIDRSRGSPALQKFFIEAFAGTLVTDFWAAYLSFDADDRQYCLVHLLRELEKVDEQNDSAEWKAFAKKLRRLIHDGIRLRKRPDFTPERYRSRITLIDGRLAELAQWHLRKRRAVYPRMTL